jgi:hypothetical protein
MRPMTKPMTTALHEVGTKKPASTLKATKPKGQMTRSQRYAVLTEKLLSAAELGAEGLVKLMQEGAIKGRDLAVTVGILIDKVAMLEQRQDPPAASVAEVLRHAQELASIAQELERRNALPAPSPATPVSFSDPGSRALQ